MWARAGPGTGARSSAQGLGSRRVLGLWSGLWSGKGKDLAGEEVAPLWAHRMKHPWGCLGPRSHLEQDTPSTGKVTHGLTQPGRMGSPTSAPQLCHLPRKKYQFYCPAWSCSECPLSFGDTSRALPRGPGSVPSAPAGCWEIPTHLSLSPSPQRCRQHLLVPLQPLHLPLDREPL